MAQGSQSVNKEAIRILVHDVGYNAAAAQLKLKPSLLRQWAKRGRWNTPTRTDERVTLVTTPPADAHAEIIQANGHATKLGLSTYARRQAEQLASKGKLKDHNAFRNVTSGASQLHGWEAKEQAPSVMVNVAILGIDPASVRISDSE